MKPLIDQTVKEGKDKKVVFECIFSKPNGKPKWYLKKDVRSKSSIFVISVAVVTLINYFFSIQNLLGNILWLSP